MEKRFKKQVSSSHVLVRESPAINKAANKDLENLNLVEDSFVFLHGVEVVRAGSPDNVVKIDVEDGSIVTISVHGISDKQMVSWGDVKYYLVRKDYIFVVTGKLDPDTLKKYTDELDNA